MGSSAGQGGSSGKVDFPGYMKSKHTDWLELANTDLLTTRAASPYNNFSPFDPVTRLGNIDTELTSYDTSVGALAENTDYPTYVTTSDSAHNTEQIDFDSFKYNVEQMFKFQERFDFDEMYDNALQKGTIGIDFNWEEIYNTVSNTLALGVQDEWDEVADKIRIFVEQELLDDEMIHQRVREFELSQRGALVDRVARFSANLAANNAIMSSAYTVGQALIVRDQDRAVQEFETQLRLESFNRKIEFITQNIPQFYSALRARFAILQDAVNSFASIITAREQTLANLVSSQDQTGRSYISAFLQAIREHGNIVAQRITLENQGAKTVAEIMRNRLQHEELLARLTAEVNRINIIANREFIDREIDLDVRHELWSLQLYQYVGNLLGSAGGGSVVYNDKDSDYNKGTALIGGILSGGASGAMLGSGAGPVGTVVGGIGGAIAGGILT